MDDFEAIEMRMLDVIRGVRTARGEDFRYPWIQRVIKDQGPEKIA